MPKTIEGIVKNGAVELSEPLDSADGTKVIVTVIEATNDGEHRPITLGMFPQLKGEVTDDLINEMKGLLEREWEESWKRHNKS